MSDTSRMFSFGENWLAFAADLSPEQIDTARRELAALFQGADLKGRTFLDIGSGSGLSSLAARQLGAIVHSFDHDPQSVECTTALRDRYRPSDPHWTIERGSILDPGYLGRLGRFDAVYSWGVLHHTGNMNQAIRNAAGLVNPGGLLALALYRRTRLCWAWKIEKRFYSRSPAFIQSALRGLYLAAYRVGVRAAGKRFDEHVRAYQAANRGMSFYRDVHDWLGGYPYESITPAELDALLRPLGFALVAAKTRGMSWGVLGSGCDEFLYQLVQG